MRTIKRTEISAHCDANLAESDNLAASGEVKCVPSDKAGEKKSQYRPKTRPTGKHSLEYSENSGLYGTAT